jgi:hypothetical protein
MGIHVEVAARNVLEYKPFVSGDDVGLGQVRTLGKGSRTQEKI